MKPVDQMTLEEVGEELLDIYRKPKSSIKGEAKVREDQLTERYQLLFKQKLGEDK